MMVEVTETCCH